MTVIGAWLDEAFEFDWPSGMVKLAIPRLRIGPLWVTQQNAERIAEWLAEHEIAYSINTAPLLRLRTDWSDGSYRPPSAPVLKESCASGPHSRLAR